MRELQLPLCATIFTLLLMITFFSKKRLNIRENIIFSIMLCLTFFESLLVTIIRIIVINMRVEDISVQLEKLLMFINKIDLFVIISITACILLYTVLITFPNIKEKVKTIYVIVIIINVLGFILIMFAKLGIISSGNMLSIEGIAIIPTYIVAGSHLLISILICLFNYKKLTKRHVPILSIVLISIMLMVFYRLNPYVVINSIAITFIVYLMYFTLENPDLRMIEALNISKSEAERANLAKSDFLASMSHEIRTPLNAITGFSYAIMAVDNLPEEAVDYAKDIVKSSDTLLEIVGGVLDVSKIESNKMEIIEVLYNPREEFESLAKLAKTRLSDKPIIFNYKIAEDVPYQLYGDKANLKKIVTNLLTNAVKYTQKGNILFSVKCINQNDISNIIISVQDTGLGIKTENISRLFNKFDRLDVAKNTTAEGTGLGLAITKKLVELMGGKINVQSQYGVGSIFVTQIPQRIAMMSKPLTDTQALSTIEIRKRNMDRETRINGKKILIVDDNALNIKVAKVALKNFDLVLDDVSSGEECINIIKSGRTYDLILMDIMMPNMGGEETFKKLKEIYGFNTPVIALTADAVSGSKDKYLEIGFTSYISKPFSPDEIKNELIKIFK